MFIKELYEYGEDIKSLIRQLRQEGKTEDVYYEDLMAKFALVRKTLNFIYKGTWLKKESARNRLKTIMDARFDYTRVADELVVSRKGSSSSKVNSLRSFMSIISKDIEKSFGSGYIDLIREGRLSDANMRLNLASGVASLDSVLLKGASDLLPKTEELKTFSLVECRTELEILRSFSVYYFEHHVLPNIDSNKLSFLRTLMEEDNLDRREERVALFKFLEGELKDFESLQYYLDI